MAPSALRAVVGALLIPGLILACDARPASNARPVSNATTGTQPFEITTRTRPESLDGYLKMYRSMHALCGVNRELMHLPPGPPLVDVPADFVTERSTYLHSGSAYLVRREEFFVDVAELDAKLGCKSRLGSSMTEELVRDGQVQSAIRNGDGTVDIDLVTPLPPPKPGGASGYTVQKNLSGFAMRCVAPDAPLGEGMHDMCVLDVASGPPLDGQGESVIVHARSTLLERANIVLLTEPVTVQVGKPVDARRLALSVSAVK
jgi:hypothetical protein